MARARGSRHIISEGLLVKELCAIRGGGSTDERSEVAADSRQSESESESEAADNYDSATSSTDDDAYGDTYDQEEAEIIEGYYSRQKMDGGDASTTDAADCANADGGSSTASNMEESKAHSTSSPDAADSSPASTTPSSIPSEIQTKRTSASDLRVAGVAHHHEGDLASAASTFLQAAQELEAGIHILEQQLPEEQEQELASELGEMVEEAATCRLHEALCHLKQQKYARCIQSCTAVLEDGVQVVPLDDNDDSANIDVDVDSADDDGTGATEKRAAVIRVTPTGGAGGGGVKSSSRPRISAAARARAYHRRAKARLALQDVSGATEDAKEAAYLGDRNAVSLYGKILREHSSASTGSNADAGFGGGLGNSAAGGSLAEMLGGNNPFLSALSGSSGSADSSQPSSALLSSLLGSGSGSDNGNNADPFGGLGSLLGFGGGLMAGKDGGGKTKRKRNRRGRGNATGGGGMDSLAKSLLKNLAKKIDDDKTQTQICNFCQGASTDQVKMYAGMAGMQMADATASQIVAFANGVTKKKLRRIVKLARRGISAVKITSKVAKVVQKYKHLIVIGLICGWAKSSWLRDVPVNKKAIKQAAKEAGKVAAMVK